MKEVVARSTHYKIAFFWCVINNGYHQLIIVSDRKRTCCSVVVHAVCSVAVHAGLLEVSSCLSSPDPLDHFLVCDPELSPWIQQSSHHCCLRVCMDHSSCSW